MLIELDRIERTRVASEGEWDASWVPVARDGCDSCLLVEEPTMRVLIHEMDPPGRRQLDETLDAWLGKLVERLEAEARNLPSNHRANLALLRAADGGDLEGARQAFDEGADADACNDIPMNALAMAAEGERPDIVELLLARGADASLPTWSPPLFRAIQKQRLPILLRLLDHGVHPEQRESSYGRTALMVAARAGWLEGVKLLAERGADVRARSLGGKGANSEATVGETALLYAVESGNEEVVTWLLEHGADPTAVNDFFGDGPLAYAIRGRRFEIVRRLLDAGADPNLPNRRGRRPLDEATKNWHMKPPDPRIVKLLRERGAT
jgi:ankyrin repeat protein